jgi:hypothetical protein
MAKAHHRGILCPSECWRQIAEALTPATATAILDGLAPEPRQWLLEMYQDRPPIAFVQDCAASTATDEFRATCVLIVTWCEAQSPTELPSEFDGIIRVRPENGTIVEWESGPFVTPPGSVP